MARDRRHEVTAGLGIVGMVLAAFPDEIWARASLAVVGSLGLFVMMRMNKRADIRGAVVDETRRMENGLAHITTHELVTGTHVRIEELTRRVEQDEIEIARRYSLVDRTRLLASQIMLFWANRRIMFGVEAEPHVVGASNVQVFESAFAPRAHDLLNEIRRRYPDNAAIQTVTKHVLTHALPLTKTDPAEIPHIAGSLNRLALRLQIEEGP